MPEHRFLSRDWSGICWTDWHALAPRRLAAIDRKPGLYKVKVAGRSWLAYVGQTGRDLRERVSALATNALRDSPPWNDPHTGGPGLWVWRMEEGLEYEVSVGYADLPEPDRQCTEDLLLFDYRRDAGESTLCNHGRFHPLWSRPSNRAAGRAMALRDPGDPNPAGGVSLPPVEAIGEPGGGDWLGLDWTQNEPLIQAGRNAPKAGGVYRLCLGDEVVYLGESENLATRLCAHRFRLKKHELHASFVPMLDPLRHHLLERETDLIGAYFEKLRRPPRFQYSPSA